MNFIIKLLLSAVAVIIASYILPGVTVVNLLDAVIVAAILALFNATLKPILVILTIPITIVTLGLFLLVINAVLIMFADFIVGGFEVNGFWWALLFSLILSVITWVFDSLSKRD